jgi:hypothetical protein
MVVRILGIITAIVGGVFLVFSVVGLFNAYHMAQFLSDVGAAYAKPIDPNDWAKHWRISSLSFLPIAVGILAAGVGMVKRRRWSLALLGAVLSVSVVFDVILNASSYPKYAFEQSDPIEIAIMILISISSFIAFYRWHPKQDESQGNT